MAINKKGKERIIASELATEATLQALVAASGGSTYRYIQNETVGAYKYYAYFAVDGWKIKRKTLSTGVFMQSEGTGDYDTAFSDKVNKTYTY
jgi:hypothetical protein